MRKREKIKQLKEARDAMMKRYESLSWWKSPLSKLLLVLCIDGANKDIIALTESVEDK